MSNSLETELSAALVSDTVPAVELSALIIKVEEAITSADAEAKLNQELVYSLDADPKQAHAAMEEAVICSGRLTTALTRLHRKRAAAENAERVAAWQSDFGSMTERRDAMAAELVTAFADMNRIAEVFSRATLFEAELSKFHQTRPSGVPGMLRGPELEARDLDAFNRDNPSLLNMVKLFALSGKAIWPIPQKRDWVQMIPTIQGQFGGTDWHRPEVQQARQAEAKAQSDRVTAFYKQQAEDRAEREFKEDQERWKNIDGAAAK